MVSTISALSVGDDNDEKQLDLILNSGNVEASIRQVNGPESASGWKQMRSQQRGDSRIQRTDNPGGGEEFVGVASATLVAARTLKNGTKSHFVGPGSS